MFRRYLFFATALTALSVLTWFYPYMPRFDSGAYIMGIESLAHGHLPRVLSHPMQPPATYPPVTMFLFAPVYRLTGGSDLALRAMLSLLWLATMIAMLIFWRKEDEKQRLPYLLALAATGSVWLYCGRIQSEIPFLLVTVAAVACLDRLKNDKRRFGGGWGPAALILVVLAGLTRQIGLMLPLGAAVYLVWDRKRLKRGFILALLFLVIGIAPGAALYSVTQPGQFSPEKSSVLRRDGWDPSKGQQSLLSRETLGRIKMNLLSSLQLAPGSLFVLDFAPQNRWLKVVFTLIFFMILLGYAIRWIRGPSAAEFYLVFYMALLWLTPWLVETRFFTVLVPWLALYLMIGTEQIVEWITKKPVWGKWASRIVVILLTIVNLSAVSTYSFEDRWSRKNNPEAEMYEWGAMHLEQGEIVLTRDPFAFYVLHDFQTMSYTLSEQKYQPKYRLSSYLANGGKIDAILYDEAEQLVVQNSLNFYHLQLIEPLRHERGWIFAKLAVIAP